MPEAALRVGELPVAAKGRNSVGWWGMLCLIATETSLFAYLLFSYGYFAVRFGRALLPNPHPSLMLSGPDTLILLSSSYTVWWAEKAATTGDRGGHLRWLGLTIGMGVVFIIVQLFEWKSKGFGLASGAYGSFFFTITGFHLAHVIAGLAILSIVWIWSAAGYITPRRHETVRISSIYWHFVDVVWLFVFSSFYLAPYLGGG